MTSVLTVLKNPLVIVLPIIFVLLLGWQYYTRADSLISVGSSNIMPNAGFDELDGNNFPAGWHFSKSADSVTSAVRAGYNSFHLLELSSPSTTTTVSMLTSPRVDVTPNKAYFYKGYYKSNMPFDLLMRTTHTDGSSMLEIVGEYAASADWTTASHAFRAGANAAHIEFIYSFSDKGDLQLDDNYLEPDPMDVYLPPQPNRTNNLIPNPGLASDDGSLPNGWTTIGNGNNSASFAYAGHGAPYLHSSVDNFKDGEEKWRYVPISTQGGRLYDFDVTYRGTAPVDIVAEYELASGQHRYETLDTLKPANEWTTTKPSTVEAPLDATSVFVTLVQHGNGFVDSKDYELYDRTKAGPLSWTGPHVSLSFDDGWLSTFTHGIAALDKYGYKSTFYIDPSSIDTDGFMSSDQVASLQSDGQELASHGYQHMDFTTLPASGITYQMSQAYQYFKQVHNEKSVDFASPFGSTDAQLIYYVRKYYQSLRSTEDGINTRQNIDPYNLKALYVGNKTPVSKIASVLSDAKAQNGWVILIYHKIDNGAPQSDTTITPVQFSSQLDAIKKSGVPVETVFQVLDDVTKE